MGSRQNPREAFCRLLITDEAAALARGRSVAGHIQAARLPPGCAILWRDKHTPEKDLAPVARAVAAACRARGVPMLVHNHIGLAPEVGAAGLHLSSDRDPEKARRQLPPGMWLGQSLHRGDEGRARAPLDYVTVAPVFAPLSKPEDVRPPLGLDGLRTFCAAAAVPVYALGGIEREAQHAASVSTGAAGTAVLSAWFVAP